MPRRGSDGTERQGDILDHDGMAAFRHWLHEFDREPFGPVNPAGMAEEKAEKDPRFGPPGKN